MKRKNNIQFNNKSSEKNIYIACALSLKLQHKFMRREREKKIDSLIFHIKKIIDKMAPN